MKFQNSSTNMMHKPSTMTIQFSVSVISTATSHATKNKVRNSFPILIMVARDEIYRLHKYLRQMALLVLLLVFKRCSIYFYPVFGTGFNEHFAQ